MVMPSESCAVTRCPEPVAYVLEGETRLEGGQVFTTDAMPICMKHRNLLKQADPNLPIRDIEEVYAW
jgi:hypothetical protein